MRWEKPESYESRIRQGKCIWEFREISINTIDWVKSKNNQARLGVSIIDDIVSSMYAAMREDDAVFPAILVYEDPSTKNKPWVIIDGNHRGAAYELLTKNLNAPHQISVFVVRGDPVDLQLLTRSWNARESMGQKEVEKRAHIREMIEAEPSLSNSRLATQFNVKPSLVRDERKQIEVIHRLNKMNVRHASPPNAFRDTHYKSLATLHDDDLLKAVAFAVKDYQLNTVQCQELVNTIPKNGTVTTKKRAMMAYLDHFREQPAIAGTKTVKVRKAQLVLMTKLRELNQLLKEKPTARDHDLVSQLDRDKARKLIVELEKRIGRLLDD